jgi:hypothetical protein
MKKYEIQPVNVDGDFMWELFETETEHVIGYYYFEEDAQAASSFMNAGGAFSGWTPSFILNEVQIRKNLNLEFSDMLSAGA